MTAATLNRAIAGIAAKRLLQTVLQVWRHCAGTFLKALRSLAITSEDDFGEGLHSVHSEPYFYESSYKFGDRARSVIVGECDRCRPPTESDNNRDESVPKVWMCSCKCKV